MEYSFINQNDQTRIIFYGNLKPTARSKIYEIIEHMNESKSENWVLDVHEFEYIDSTGMGMMIELHEAAKNNDITLSIEGANALVKRMFEISNFQELFHSIT